MSLRQRRQVVRQRRDRTAQTPLQPTDLARAGFDPYDRRRLLTMAEAAAYLRYQGPRAAESVLKALRKDGVTLQRRGGCFVVRLGACDDWLQGLTALNVRARELAHRHAPSLPRAS